MAGGFQFKMDTREFDATMRRYSLMSKRDPKVICDTKAFFIARRAVIETPKADQAAIKGYLGRIIRKNNEFKRLALRKVLTLTKSGQVSEAPVAALIMNKRRGKRLGAGSGLYGTQMAEALRAMIGGRMKSIAFIKSGWLPAIKALESLADTKGAPRQDRSAVQVGDAKGNARPASGGWTSRTTITNTASTTRDHKQALYKYGEPALQRAIDFETASMLAYMERKLKKTASEAGVRTA